MRAAAPVWAEGQGPQYSAGKNHRVQADKAPPGKCAEAEPGADTHRIGVRYHKAAQGKKEGAVPDPERI
jgi:hypothetical protein